MLDRLAWSLIVSLAVFAASCGASALVFGGWP